MGQDFQKLQEYKSVGESLTKVWGFVSYDNEIELYDSLDLALAAAEENGCQDEVGEVSVRTATFWQLHKDLFLAEMEEKEEEELEEDEDLDEDEVYYEDEPHPYTLNEYVAPAPAPKPTTADIQARLKDLAKFKSAMPQRQPATTVTATPVQAPVQAQSNEVPTNNDGRLTCYACGEPTKMVDTGFSRYCVCTACGR